MKYLLCLLLIASCSLAAQEKDSIVCIHGYMGSPLWMRGLEKNLKKDGWDVVNWGYPSQRDFIVHHGEELVKCLEDLAKKNPHRPIHFVTHSMGGLVLLAALNQPHCPEEAKIGRVVLIAPPIQGSSWARALSRFMCVRKIMKEYSGKELMTKLNFSELGTYPLSLEKILVISGSLGFNPFLSGQNDGTLTLKETFLTTPHEHAIVKRGHKTIVFSKKVIKLTRKFFSDAPNFLCSKAYSGLEEI